MTPRNNVWLWAMTLGFTVLVLASLKTAAAVTQLIG